MKSSPLLQYVTFSAFSSSFSSSTSDKVTFSGFWEKHGFTQLRRTAHILTLRITLILLFSNSIAFTRAWQPLSRQLSYLNEAISVILSDIITLFTKRRMCKNFSMNNHTTNMVHVPTEMNCYLFCSNFGRWNFLQFRYQSFGTSLLQIKYFK